MKMFFGGSYTSPAIQRKYIQRGVRRRLVTYGMEAAAENVLRSYGVKPSRARKKRI